MVDSVVSRAVLFLRRMNMEDEVSRIDQYKMYRERVRKCHLCGDEDVTHTKNIKSAPAFFHPENCEVLIIGFAPEEIDHTRKQVSVFTGETGKVIKAILQKIGLSGDTRLGYSTVIKCKLNEGNAKIRCGRTCSAEHLAWEINFIQPKVIFLMGMDTIRVLMPTLKKVGYDKEFKLDGESFLLIDQWYVFSRDPNTLLERGKFNQKTTTGDFISLTSSFIAMKKLL